MLPLARGCGACVHLSLCWQKTGVHRKAQALTHTCVPYAHTHACTHNTLTHVHAGTGTPVHTAPTPQGPAAPQQCQEGTPPPRALSASTPLTPVHPTLGPTSRSLCLRGIGFQARSKGPLQPRAAGLQNPTPPPRSLHFTTPSCLTGQSHTQSTHRGPSPPLPRHIGWAWVCQLRVRMSTLSPERLRDSPKATQLVASSEHKRTLRCTCVSPTPGLQPATINAFFCIWKIFKIFL